MISGRPILGTAADRDLFVGRMPELRTIVRCVEQGLSCLISGSRGMGKSSLLNVGARLAERELDVDTFVVRAGRYTELNRLLYVVARHAHPETVPVAASSEEYLRIIGDGSRGRQCAVFLDDLPGQLAFELFGLLRDEVWEQNLSWIVVVNDADFAEAVRPPADVFWERRIMLHGLNDKDVEALLVSRVDGDEDLVAQVLRNPPRGAAAGNPRMIVERLRNLSEIDPYERDRYEQSIAEYDELVERLDPSAADVLGALRVLGPSSPSDERLQRDTGLSRPRLVQILTALEAQGLVAARNASTGRPGRPQRLYEAIGFWKETA